MSKLCWESQQKSGENIDPMPPLLNMMQSMKINPMNKILGMNPGLNPYSNISYGNMMPMPIYNNNNGNNKTQYNTNHKTKKNIT